MAGPFVKTFKTSFEVEMPLLTIGKAGEPGWLKNKSKIRILIENVL